ncbi:MAG: flagellar basal body-associated FliL family protein [Lentilitoribacter sp.]
MIKKSLPVLLFLIGTGSGIGAGLFLRPAGEEMSDSAEMITPHLEKPESEKMVEYVKLNNQFVIPVIERERVRSLVVMTLTVEVPAGQKDVIYAKEPKLRDSFLQVLFDHANMGGFSGEFTDPAKLEILRNSLLEIGQRDMRDGITDVLITDVARQDY